MWKGDISQCPTPRKILTVKDLDFTRVKVPNLLLNTRLFILNIFKSNNKKRSRIDAYMYMHTLCVCVDRER